MKHAGIARRAAIKLIVLPLAAILALAAAGLLLGWPHWLAGTASALAVLWLLFSGFTLYFFRDPVARTPATPGLAVSPAHGTVDAIEVLPASPCFPDLVTGFPSFCRSLIFTCKTRRSAARLPACGTRPVSF